MCGGLQAAAIVVVVLDVSDWNGVALLGIFSRLLFKSFPVRTVGITDKKSIGKNNAAFCFTTKDVDDKTSKVPTQCRWVKIDL